MPDLGFSHVSVAIGHLTYPGVSWRQATLIMMGHCGAVTEIVRCDLWIKILVSAFKDVNCKAVFPKVSDNTTLRVLYG